MLAAVVRHKVCTNGSYLTETPHLRLTLLRCVVVLLLLVLLLFACS